MTRRSNGAYHDRAEMGFDLVLARDSLLFQPGITFGFQFHQGHHRLAGRLSGKDQQQGSPQCT